MSRADQPKFLLNRFGQYIKNSVLDVGADKCHLRKWLPETTRYIGIGKDCVNQEYDLESGVLSFADNSFDTVLCLATLEHIEQIHSIFDELCRVSREYVIVSLPCSYASAYEALFFRNHKNGYPMKFYNLPVDPPRDRHRWFFSHKEGMDFCIERGSRNGFKVIDSELTGYMGRGPRLKGLALWFIEKFLINKTTLTEDDFRYHLQWVVLKKQ